MSFLEGDTLSLDSIKSKDEAQPYHLSDIETSKGYKVQSHTGLELSKILSGVRDDREQQDQIYKDIAFVESGLAQVLTRNEEAFSRRTSVSLGRDNEENMGFSGDNLCRRAGDADSNRIKSVEQINSTSVVSLDRENYNATSHSNDNTEAKISQPGQEEDDYGPPMDKGFAWIIAICLMFLIFSTWGVAAAYGVFLNYYITENSFPGASEYDYALIGGIINSLAQMMAPICLLSYKVIGPFWTCGLGIVFQTVGYILASFATKIWQLYMTQGVIVGILFLFIFLPATLMLPTWFKKHKATAMGITVSGSGLGGLFFALVSQKLMQQTGNQKWALRMIAIVSCTVAAICCLVIKPRNYKPLPLTETLKKEFIFLNAKAVFSFRVFQEKKTLIILGVWFGLAILGYILVLYTVSAYATLVGLTKSQGSIITAVLNAAQVIGRPSCGAFADRLGRFNWTIINCIFISVLIWAFWINATTYGSLLAFAVCIGCTIGVGSLFAQPLASDIVGDQSKLPSAWSGLNIIVGLFCIFSEVMALGIRNQKSSKPYLNTQIFGGVCFFLDALLLLVIRETLVRRTLNDRLDESKEQLMTKSGYLKKYEQDDKHLIEGRIQRYNILLETRIKSYFYRMFYPIKI